MNSDFNSYTKITKSKSESNINNSNNNSDYSQNKNININNSKFYVYSTKLLWTYKNI